MPDCIDELIAREGGFSDAPDDRGGPTKYGITLRTLSAWRGHSVTRDDIANLDVAEARAIYRRKYLEETHIDQIPSQALQNCIFDIAVLSGPETAIKLLQMCLHELHEESVYVDGMIGPQTLAALWGHDPVTLIHGIIKKRIIMLVEYVQHNPSQLKWLKGWILRTLGFLEG